MAIYITGDTHCPNDIDKLTTQGIKQRGLDIKEGDFLIIAGDGGFVWDNSPADKWWQNWILEKPWTTIVVPGNHENYNLIKEFPEVDFYGAAANKINDKLYYIKRGEILTLEGKTFLCIGGARSTDKLYRTENVSWWADELPTHEELNQIVEKLEKQPLRKFDFIITHTAPVNLIYRDSEIFYRGKIDLLQEFLFKEIHMKFEFDKWYFGHYHTDMAVTAKHIIIYDYITQVN